jgi:hypothetical protein
MKKEYPLYDMDATKYVYLSNEQIYILRLHLNRAALNDDWDAFRIIINEHSDEYLLCDAHNIAFLFGKEVLCRTLVSQIHTEKI